jgi:beta-aspartyl-peptidase (threonine type)
MRAGAVAGIRNVKNPVQLARKVMEHTEHVLLAGDGALQFAEAEGVTMETDEYFITPLRHAQLQSAKEKTSCALDHVEPPSKLGTVGAVALDADGNIAAATSTGGLTNKKFGRVGDTPIIGAGVYAENETCGVSATGIGEQILRTSLAKTIADIIRYKDISAEEATKEGMDFFISKVKGQGGVIVIDKNGDTAIAHSTPGILAGGYNTKQGVFLVF